MKALNQEIERFEQEFEAKQQKCQIPAEGVHGMCEEVARRDTVLMEG